MKFKVQFGGNELLLTAEQLDAMTNIAEGAIVWEEKYVGTDKGYMGHEQNYELRLPTFHAYQHLAFRVLSSQEMAKWETLIAYRKQAEESAQ